MKLLIAAKVAVGVVAVVGAVSSCTCGPTFPDPCASDRTACADDAEFPRLEACDAEGDLRVEVGDGDRGFAPLAAGQPVTVYFGPQGGQHVELGVRVTNARLDQYDRLRFTLWIAQGADCEAGAPTPEVPESCGDPLGLRQLVLGGEGGFPLNVRDGVVEEHDLLVFLYYLSPGARTVVTAVVEDPCGRLGVAAHVFTAP